MNSNELETEKEYQKRIVNEVRQYISCYDVLTHYSMLPENPPRMETEVLCPFHQDSKPSARVYPKDGNMWCFSCKIPVNPVSFVEKMQGFRFNQAVNMLQEVYGFKINGLGVLKKREYKTDVVANEWEAKIFALKGRLPLDKYLHMWQLYDAGYMDAERFDEIKFSKY